MTSGLVFRQGRVLHVLASETIPWGALRPATATTWLGTLNFMPLALASLTPRLTALLTLNL